MTNLKPCPFCGGEARIERIGDRSKSTIYECGSCGCRLETCEEFNHGSVWNTRHTEPVKAQEGEPITENTSDGYHTFKELYECRHALFVALLRSNPSISWRANNNDDGTQYEGWFVAGMHLPSGDVSFHLPISYWELLDGCLIATTNCAPPFDGHNTADVIKRLLTPFHPTTERPYNPLNDYAVIPMAPTTEPVKAQAGESRKTMFEQALDEVMETGGIFPTTERRVIPEDAELLAFAADEQFFLFCEELEVLDIMRTTLQKYLNAAPKGEV